MLHERNFIINLYDSKAALEVSRDVVERVDELVSEEAITPISCLTEDGIMMLKKGNG